MVNRSTFTFQLLGVLALSACNAEKTASLSKDTGESINVSTAQVMSYVQTHENQPAFIKAVAAAKAKPLSLLIDSLKRISAIQVDGQPLKDLDHRTPQVIKALEYYSTRYHTVGSLLAAAQKDQPIDLTASGIKLAVSNMQLIQKSMSSKTAGKASTLALLDVCNASRTVENIGGATAVAGAGATAAGALMQALNPPSQKGGNNFFGDLGKAFVNYGAPAAAGGGIAYLGGKLGEATTCQPARPTVVYQRNNPPSRIPARAQVVEDSADTSARDSSDDNENADGTVGGYTCEQQRGWGKCDRIWMHPVCDDVCEGT